MQGKPFSFLHNLESRLVASPPPREAGLVRRPGEGDLNSCLRRNDGVCYSVEVLSNFLPG